VPEKCRKIQKNDYKKFLTNVDLPALIEKQRNIRKARKRTANPLFPGSNPGAASK